MGTLCVTLLSPTFPGYFHIRSSTPLVPDLAKPQELEGTQEEEPLCYWELAKSLETVFFFFVVYFVFFPSWRFSETQASPWL